MTDGNELVITRTFDAPVALVWRAWSEPEHFSKWFGPNGLTVPHCTIDFRVGGANTCTACKAGVSSPRAPECIRKLCL